MSSIEDKLRRIEAMYYYCIDLMDKVASIGSEDITTLIGQVGQHSTSENIDPNEVLNDFNDIMKRVDMCIKFIGKINELRNRLITYSPRIESFNLETMIRKIAKMVLRQYRMQRPVSTPVEGIRLAMEKIDEDKLKEILSEVEKLEKERERGEGEGHG